MKIIGVDLASKTNNPSGIAFLIDSRLKTTLLYTNDQILRKIFSFNPSLVGIDAPITKNKGPWRPAEKELLKRGFKPLPLNLGSMRKLAKRAVNLSKKIERNGIKVIETFPQATKKILGIKEPKDFKKYDFEVELGKSEHELDASLVVVTSYLYLKGKTESLGKEEQIIIPKTK